MKTAWFWVMAGLTLLTVAYLCATDLPLGVPSEWTWRRIPYSDDGTNPLVTIGIGAALAAIFGSLYLLVAWSGLRHIAEPSRFKRSLWMCGLMTAGTAWLFALQESPAEGFQLSKAPWVLYYPSMTGYFTKARFEITDTQQFLADYETLMAEGDVLHVGTHPPGMFLIYRGLLAAVANMPSVIPLIEATIPTSAHEAFQHIEQHPVRPEFRWGPHDRAIIWWGVWLAHASVVLSIVPLFALLRRWMPAEDAWKSVCFWPLLPALAIFLPKDDVLFTGWVALFLTTWLTAVQRRSFLCGCLAGVLGWCGLILSLVFLPIGAIAFLAGAGSHWDSTASNMRSHCRSLSLGLWKPVTGGLIAVVSCVVLVDYFTSMNLINVWVANYRNHAAFYSQYSRTKWLWCLVNPLELCVAVGVPVMWLAVRGGHLLYRSRQPELRAHRALALAIALVWGALWMSGKNSGEAARLWIPLLPFLICLLRPLAAESGSTRDDRQWLCFLALQAVVCIATVMCVSGFHYG